MSNVATQTELAGVEKSLVFQEHHQEKSEALETTLMETQKDLLKWPC